MTLTIERLHTRLHAPVPIDAARCDAWQSALVAQDGDALGAGLVGEDEWLLIRRLRISTRWRADAVDADIGRLWGRALRHVIDEALAGGDRANCVRYRNRRAAIADMVYRSALGERTRQWAWQRMGLIARADMSCEEALAAGVALLLQAPELIWPVLQRLVEAEEAAAALTAVLRMLPASAWAQLLAASPRTSPYAAVAPGAPSSAAEAIPLASAAEDVVDIDGSSAGRRLLAWAAARPYLVRRHLEILAVLLAALVWPAVGRGGEAARRRRGLAHARLVAPPPRMRPDRALVAADGMQAELARHPADEATEQAGATPALPELPELPEPERWQPTRWAGALFWLGRMAASGAFEWLDRQEDAPADGPRLLLHAVARALGVPDDDVAHSVFCGGSVPRREVPARFTAYAEALIARWAVWLDDAAPELPEPRLVAVCRRSGRIRQEPGWIELHLPLAGVETSIRRLGLDLDPGWLPWLGCVLRIHYDD
jgi:hypothetical protein